MLTAAAGIHGNALGFTLMTFTSLPGTYNGPTSCSQSGFTACNQMFLLKVVLFPQQWEALLFLGICFQQLITGPSFRTVSAFRYHQAVRPREASVELWKCSLTPVLCASVGGASQSNLDDLNLFCSVRLAWNPGPLHTRRATCHSAAP